MTFFVTHDVSDYGDVIKRWCKQLCQKKWQWILSQRKGHNFVLGRAAGVFAPSCIQSRPGPVWLLAISHHQVEAGWKEVVAGAGPRKGSEFRAARYTCIGVPQRLSAVAREAATLCGEQRRVLGIMLKVSTPWVLYFLRYDTTCRTYWMTRVKLKEKK